MKFMIMPTRQDPCCGGKPLGSKTVGLANGDYGFLVRGADGKPVALKSASDNGSGGDPEPLCEYCPGSAHLAENYRVIISGFPAVCNVGTFNGAWTVTWVLDCTWRYDITAYHRPTLYFNGTSKLQLLFPSHDSVPFKINPACQHISTPIYYQIDSYRKSIYFKRISRHLLRENLISPLFSFK